jgi:hypothetical protein
MGFAMNNDPRTGLTRLIEEIESSAHKRGADDTRERFSGTVREAIRLLSSLLEAGAETATKIREISTKGASKKKQQPEPRAGSAQLRVLNIVRAFSDLRTNEIRDRLQGEVSGPSVRSALNRLKDRGAIVQKKRAWFAVEGDSQKPPPA